MKNLNKIFRNWTLVGQKGFFVKHLKIFLYVSVPSLAKEFQ